jgi:hypothetical protein
MTDNKQERPVELLCSDECARGLNETIATSRETDLTVTSSAVNYMGPGAAAGTQVLVLTWETVSGGFGELTIYLNDAGEVEIDSERMSKEFVKSVLAKWVDQIAEDGKLT